MHEERRIHLCELSVFTAAREDSIPGVHRPKTFLTPKYSVTSLKMQAANRLQKALRTGSGLTFGAYDSNLLNGGPVS